ncbi:hypothetical protein DPMN_031407 [Dreissena polymorpha]|uniref:Uncharacterized protein n=1 Tax=Dreissena polymorpha TaxID=45954 RepID=A0A9D4M2A9_DREPO|nr:hypothetical protein DPMN_031407 [Dreissena polymorpha]
MLWVVGPSLKQDSVPPGEAGGVEGLNLKTAIGTEIHDSGINSSEFGDLAGKMSGQQRRSNPNTHRLREELSFRDLKPGNVAYGARAHFGNRSLRRRVLSMASSTCLVIDGSRDRAPVKAIALYKKGPGFESKNMDHSLMKRVLRDSKPGSDAYVAGTRY